MNTGLGLAVHTVRWVAAKSTNRNSKQIICITVTVNTFAMENLYSCRQLYVCIVKA